MAVILRSSNGNIRTACGYCAAQSPQEAIYRTHRGYEHWPRAGEDLIVVASSLPVDLDDWRQSAVSTFERRGVHLPLDRLEALAPAAQAGFGWGQFWDNSIANPMPINAKREHFGVAAALGGRDARQFRVDLDAVIDQRIDG